jgi:hypothetical protein
MILGDRMKTRTLPLSLGATLGVTLAIGLSANPASAKQFTKLVQLGQIVPGNSRPVDDIIEPTIGFDGQVAVRLSTLTLSSPPPTGDNGPTFSSSKSYSGIYSIPKNGSLRLIEEGEVQSDRFSTGTIYSAPAISQGKIAYVATTLVPGPDAPFLPAKLQISQSGNIQTALAFELAPAAAVRSGQTFALVNGKAFLLTDAYSAAGVFQPGILWEIDTRSAKPALKVLDTNTTNFEIRASSQILLKTTSTDPRTNANTAIAESVVDGNFRAIAAPANIINPGSCGASTSADNIVICGNKPVANGGEPKLSVRFGKAGKFIDLPRPADAIVSISISNPSISNRSVIFQASVPLIKAPAVDKIYLSQNAAPPTVLVSAGQKIDGKTISKLSLSRNGRTIADNAAVFTATFTDGTTALYRVDW